MREIIVISGQTLHDLVIQECGRTEMLFPTAEVNDLSISEPLKPGAAITIPENEENAVSQFYATRALKPANGWNETEQDAALEGIGYWVIEADFIVS